MENGDSMCVFLNIDLDALFYGFLNDMAQNKWDAKVFFIRFYYFWLQF